MFLAEEIGLRGGRGRPARGRALAAASTSRLLASAFFDGLVQAGVQAFVGGAVTASEMAAWDGVLAVSHP